MASYVLKFEVNPHQAAGIMDAAQQLDAAPYYLQEGGDTIYDFESDGVDPFSLIPRKRSDHKQDAHSTGCDVRSDNGAVADPPASPPRATRRLGSQYARR